MIFYRITHEYFDEPEECDIVTNIALYSSKEKAEHALKKFKKHPKFSDHPGGFSIDECKVDLLGWSEGFVPF